MRAPSPKELTALRLYETGTPVWVISCSLGMPKAAVEAVIAARGESTEARRHKAELRRGSAFLLKAIQLTGKRHRSVGR
jgi:hypothetical protein